MGKLGLLLQVCQQIGQYNVVPGQITRRGLLRLVDLQTRPADGQVRIAPLQSYGASRRAQAASLPDVAVAAKTPRGSCSRCG